MDTPIHRFRNISSRQRIRARAGRQAAWGAVRGTVRTLLSVKKLQMAGLETGTGRSLYFTAIPVEFPGEFLAF